MWMLFLLFYQYYQSKKCSVVTILKKWVEATWITPWKSWRVEKMIFLFFMTTLSKNKVPNFLVQHRIILVSSTGKYLAAFLLSNSERFLCTIFEPTCAYAHSGLLCITLCMSACLSVTWPKVARQKITFKIQATACTGTCLWYCPIKACNMVRWAHFNVKLHFLYYSIQMCKLDT